MDADGTLLDVTRYADYRQKFLLTIYWNFSVSFSLLVSLSLLLPFSPPFSTETVHKIRLIPREKIRIKK